VLPIGWPSFVLQLPEALQLIPANLQWATDTTTNSTFLPNHQRIMRIQRRERERGERRTGIKTVSSQSDAGGWRGKKNDETMKLLLPVTPLAFTSPVAGPACDSCIPDGRQGRQQRTMESWTFNTFIFSLVRSD